MDAKPSLQELWSAPGRVWICPDCGYIIDDRKYEWTHGHEDCDSEDPLAAIPPNCSGFSWNAMVHAPRDMEPFEVVPRADAEALAEALERVRARMPEDAPYYVGDDALASYRASYPKAEET